MSSSPDCQSNRCGTGRNIGTCRRPRKAFQDHIDESSDTESWKHHRLFDGSAEFQDDCGPKFGTCAERKKCLKDAVRVKTVEAYNVDTCLISWKPRLIVVPSDRFPTIDSAFEKLEPNKGGYVIMLKPGTHVLNTMICEDVDKLTIIGDCCPFAGIPFVQSCRNFASIETDPCNCGNPENFLGKGPYNITISGRRVTVTGSTNPCFNTLCTGRNIIFVRSDGSSLTTSLVNASGNSFLVRDDLGISQGFRLGEGFFIAPNVTITTDCSTIRIDPTEILNLEGIFWTAPAQLGTNGIVLRTGRSVFATPIQIFGNYNFTQPNVFLDFVRLAPSSRGRARHQVIIGRNARLYAESVSTSAWQYSIFSSTANGATLNNGSIIDFFSSDFLNCCTGILARCNSTANLLATFFCNNLVGAMAHYGSTLSSYFIDEPAPAVLAIQFITNGFAIVLDWRSNGIFPNAIYQANDRFMILDGFLFDTPSSVGIGTYGQRQSLIIQGENPVIVDMSSFQCTLPRPAQLADASIFNGILGANGNQSYPAIASTSSTTLPGVSIPLTNIQTRVPFTLQDLQQARVQRENSGIVTSIATVTNGNITSPLSSVGLTTNNGCNVEVGSVSTGTGLVPVSIIT